MTGLIIIAAIVVLFGPGFYLEITRPRPVVGGLYSVDGRCVFQCVSHQDFLLGCLTEYEIVDHPLPGFVGRRLALRRDTDDTGTPIHHHPYRPPELDAMFKRAGDQP